MIGTTMATLVDIRAKDPVAVEPRVTSADERSGSLLADGGRIARALPRGGGALSDVFAGRARTRKACVAHTREASAPIAAKGVRITARFSPTLVQVFTSAVDECESLVTQTHKATDEVDTYFLGVASRTFCTLVDVDAGLAVATVSNIASAAVRSIGIGAATSR